MSFYQKSSTASYDLSKNSLWIELGIVGVSLAFRFYERVLNADPLVASPSAELKSKSFISFLLIERKLRRASRTRLDILKPFVLQPQLP